MAHKIGPWIVFGKTVDPRDALIPIHSPLAQWGFGVFSTGKIISGTLLGGLLHIERLRNHAMKMGIADEPDLKRLVQEWLFFFKDVSTPLRTKIILSKDNAPSMMAYTLPVCQEVTAASLLCDRSHIVPKNGFWATIKATSCAEYRLLHTGDGAVLHDEEGRIVETTSSAFWFLLDNKLFYPDPELCGLDSITQRLMLCEAGHTYHPVCWRGTLEDIPPESHCYISNCVQGIRPVVSIGNRTFSVSRDETRSLQALLHRAFIQHALCYDSRMVPNTAE